MKLSIRTLIGLGSWARLVRGLDEGENTIPNLTPAQWDTLKSVCYRENRTQTARIYTPSNRGGVIKINVKTT